MKRVVRKGAFMKRMIERYFCDVPNCSQEAKGVCSACERDIYGGHRGWISTKFLHGLSIPVVAVDNSGFNLCKDCIVKFEQVFNDQRRPGDGYGPMPKVANVS